MSNAGMSFGGGFASGIANVLSQKRERDHQDKQNQIANNWKMFGVLANSGQLNGIEDLQPFIDSVDLGLDKPKGGAKGKGGAVDPKEHFTTILGHILRNGKGEATGRGEDAGPMVGATPSPAAMQAPAPSGPNDAGESMAPTELPSRGLPQPSPSARASAPQRTFMGVPMMSQEQVMERKLGAEAAQTTQRVQLARDRIYPALKAVDKDATMEDALAYAFGKTPPSRSQRYGSAPQVGSFGDYVKRQEAETGHTLTPDEVESARREWASASQSLGMLAERAAGQLGFKSAADARAAGAMDQVNQLAQQMAVDAAGATTTARVDATNAGVMRKPADFATAQERGVPVGTTPEQAIGATVPTTAQNESRASITSLKTSLENIRDNLLDVLPSETETIGGIAPGAVTMARRRMPSYRNKFAALDAAVNNIVNVVARTVAQQRGMQSEKDAQRAEAAITQLQSGLLSGDTRESAAARIKETLETLERVAAAIPAPIAAKAPAAPATTTKPGAYVLVNGKWVRPATPTP